MDAAELRDETSGLCTEGKCGEWVRSHWGMRRTTTGWTSLSQHKETMRRTDEVHCIHEFARRLLEAEATMMRGRSLLLMGLTLELDCHFDEDIFDYFGG